MLLYGCTQILNPFISESSHWSDSPQHGSSNRTIREKLFEEGLSDQAKAIKMTDIISLNYIKYWFSLSVANHEYAANVNGLFPMHID